MDLAVLTHPLARSTSRSHLLLGAVAAGALVLAPRAARAQLSQPDAEHSQEAPSAVAQPSDQEAAPAAREWFGGRPWLEWDHATGDWGGVRTGLSDSGLDIEASLVYQWSSVFSGGLSRRASTRSLLTIKGTLDLDKFIHLPGGTVYAEFQSTDMRGGSRDAGDAQGLYVIESGENVHQLGEIWYEQLLFDDALRVRVGKIDANTDFDVVNCAEVFLHTSAAISPTLITNPTYPDPAFGAEVFWTPAEHTSIGLGFFDGSLAAGVHTGRLGPAPLFHGNEYYFVGELAQGWESLGGLGAGRLAAGGWINTALFTTTDGSEDRATQGAYALVEQQLVTRGDKADADHGLFVFARAGYADREIAFMHSHLAAGLTLAGTFQGRDDDAAGLFVSYVGLTDTPDDETAIEALYKLTITPFFAVTMDLQTVFHPSGDPDVDTAVVGALSFEVTF